MRPAFDSGLFSRTWRFRVAAAYIPRDAVRHGEELRIRFVVRNESRHEGTIYYVVNLWNVYDEREFLYSSDLTDRRHGFTACIDAHEQQCVEHVISWDELTRRLPATAMGELFLAIEIQLWTPGRVRVDAGGQPGRRGGWPPRGMFQWVELMHNPGIVLRQALASCFISYAWRGRRDYPPNLHRGWVYRLADSLSRCGLLPVIDHNFLAPALVNRKVIERALEQCDRILLVYSDDYVDRMDDPRTGVGFEYGLIRARPKLWAKTIPIRRGLRDREEALFSRETRLVEDFEGESMVAQAAALFGYIAGLDPPSPES